MKFALIGRSIQHSLSPDLYRDIIGPHIQYDLIDCADESQIPSLEELSKKYNGVNITAPYKEHFLKDVEVSSDVLSLKAINTISFVSGKVLATNTDLIATEKILSDYQEKYPSLKVLLLGSGAMARLTELCLKKLKIDYEIFSRKSGSDMSFLDLASHSHEVFKTLVINSCSRDFVFQGKLHPEFLFWDYNYRFLPHQNTLPSLVFSYQDGQAMLRLQAEAAAQFWFSTNPKLKC